MSGTECDSCGTSNPVGSHYCQACGLALSGSASGWLGGSRYTPLRWQIDPMDPPPRRDARWVTIVLGASLLIVGAMLFAVSAIVGSAVSAGATGCTTGGCEAAAPAEWFAWASAPFVGVGAVLLSVGLWRALR